MTSALGLQRRQRVARLRVLSRWKEANAWLANMNFLALQLSQPDINLALILPELIVCLVGVIVMMVDAFTKPTQRWVTGGISLAGLVAAAAASVWLWLSWHSVSEAFNGMIVLDELRLGF